MDDKKKYIYKDLVYTILFLLSFIFVYFVLYVNPVPVVSSPVAVYVLGFIPVILLIFAVFFFFTLLNQIFSEE
ncbi:MAG: hypothetical protein ACTSO6_06805 [Promethearchaeota archaeon]